MRDASRLTALHTYQMRKCFGWCHVDCGFGTGNPTAATPMCVFRGCLSVGVIVKGELCVDLALYIYSACQL